MELLKRTIHRNDVRQEGQLQTILEEDVNLPETKPDVGTICMERGRIVTEEVRPMTDAVTLRGKLVFSTNRAELALTLLRAPLVPDDTCDRGEHRFTYSLLPFAGAFRDSGVTRAGYALNLPVQVLPGVCPKAAGMWCDSASILLEYIKPAEDGRGVILRLYESSGETASGVLRLPAVKNIFLSSMDETQKTFLCQGKEMPLTLRPFEIRTLRLTD